MKVFVSWSGTESHQVAMALRDWLPNVIQCLVPYVSSEDIDKGARWSSDIAGELQDSRFGILCVTPENREAPWLMFEAGALSKSLETSLVSPFLVGVKRSEVTGPILQFQSTVFERDDVLKLMRTMNAACGDMGIPEPRLEDAFTVWWPQLDSSLKAIAAMLPSSRAAVNASPRRSEQDILEEILELSRSSVRLLASPTELLPPEYINEVLFDRDRVSARRLRHALPDSDDILRDAVVAYNRAFIVATESRRPSAEDIYERLKLAEGPLSHAARVLSLSWDVDAVRALVRDLAEMSRGQARAEGPSGIAPKKPPPPKPR